LCQDAGFTAIPNTLHSEIQVLDLAGNNIPYLTKKAFSSVGLTNLQQIFMRGTGVREIHKNAFRDLKVLSKVDLSHNAVSYIHPQTFKGNYRLRELNLNGNPLTELSEKQFPPLPHFTTLELQDCQLSHIHTDAFVHVPMLESLDLKRNQLRQLSEKVFLPLVNLKTLVLDGNPWKCDCDLRGFRNWLLDSHLYSISLTCSEPEALTGRFWQEVTPLEFACAPEVRLGETIVQEELGGNVTFRCHVRGDPEPEVTWLFNGRPLRVGSSGNSSFPEKIFVVEKVEIFHEKWIGLSVYNVSEQDAGEYSCAARNTRGVASRNVSLLLPKVATAGTLSKTEFCILCAGIAAVGETAICLVLLAVVYSCRKRRKHHRRKAKPNGIVSFTEQENLLDVNITKTDRPPQDLGSQPEMKVLEQSSEHCEAPLHITIENRNLKQPAVGDIMPVAAISEPPEFSTDLPPAGASSNFYISLSVGQLPTADGKRCDAELLDIPHRTKAATNRVSMAGGPDATYCPNNLVSYATPSRRQPLQPQYDNMGPRVTAGGISTLSLPHTDLSMESPGFLEGIPPPPLPPLCTPLPSEYVAL
jgi:hypothetical protein